MYNRRKTSSAIHRYFADEKDFIRENRNSILKSNIEILKKMNLVYLVMQLFCVTTVFFREGRHIFILSAFVVVQIIFSVYVFLGNREKYFTYRKTQNIISIFGVLIMSYVMFISLVVTPQQVSLFFSPMMMCMALLYVFQIKRILFRISCYSIIYLILAYFIEPSNVFVQDCVLTVTAWCVAGATGVAILSLRVKDNKMRMELRRISGTDQLTGLVNKITFETICKNRLATSDERHGKALFVIDIDDYKCINDTYGHQLGDKILTDIAETLRKNFRANDVIGRFGGDEFTVMLCGINNEMDIMYRADNICKQVKETAIKKYGIEVTCSIGIAFVLNKTVPYEEFFKIADEALYKMKNDGKDNYKISNM